MRGLLVERLLLIGIVIFELMSANRREGRPSNCYKWSWTSLDEFWGGCQEIGWIEN